MHSEGESVASANPPIETEHIGARSSFPRMAAIFSFPVMCLFLLIPVIFGFSVRNIAEPDIWWHLRNGEQIVLHHSVPRVDTYSFGAAGAPIIDFEWLSEVPYFVAFHACGLRGVLLVYFGVLVLIFAGVYYRSCRSGADCKSATVTTLLAILLGVVSIGPRMLLFGWLCMVSLLIILDHFRQTGRKLWLLPPLFLLWVNFHPSWLFGLIVIGITIAGGFVEGEWGLVTAQKWTRSQLKQLCVTLVACAGALFINPYGYRLAFYPFDFLFRQGSNTKFTQEWQPVDFTTGGGKVALLLILGLFLAAWFSRRRWALPDLLLSSFAIWAALSHVRMLFFAGLIIPPLLAVRLTFFPPYDPEIDKPWLNGAIIVGLIAGMAYCYPSAAKLQQDVDSQYPTAALAYIQQHQLQGNIFDADWWGGYMEWHDRHLKPQMDGRADIFIYNGVFDDHVKAGLIDNTFEIMEKYGIAYALIEPDTPLAYLLDHSKSWRKIYSDKVAVIFERLPDKSPSSSAKLQLSGSGLP